MAGECAWCDKALPQWCGDCGGFIGWHCAICGESRVDTFVTRGHCRCVGGSTQWVDGPMPTIGLLMDAGMKMDGVGDGGMESRAAYMAAIVMAAVEEKGN